MLDSPFQKLNLVPAVVFAILMMYLGLGIFSMLQQSMTYDEPRHWRYGQSVLNGNTTRFDDSKMPATALNVLPVAAKRAFFPHLKWDTGQVLRVSRLVTLVAAVLLGWLVYAWARELGGNRAGLLGLLLFVLDPNLAAHAQWVTTDIYGALGATLAIYLFWRFLKRPSVSRGIWAGIGLGLSLLAKFTSVYLFILLPVTAVLYGRIRPGKTDRDDWAGSVILSGTLALNICLAVLAAGYLGNGWGTALSGYNFKSDLFLTLQKSLGFISHIPLPFPKPFIEGLDWVKYYESNSMGRGPAYLFGQLSESPFPNYYAWAVWFKLPAGILLITFWTVCAGAVRMLRPSLRPRCSADLAIPIVSAVFFMVYFNFFCKAQLGIRLLLVVFPALYVYAGTVLSNELAQGCSRDPEGPKLGRLKVLTFVVLAGWAGISVGGHYPHLLGYFNEMAGKPVHYYRILADSNLEWGQNDLFVKSYVARHPHVQINPRKPQVGRVAISANFLLGIVWPKKYTWTRWLIQHKEPVDHIAYGYLVYDLTQQDISEISRL